MANCRHAWVVESALGAIECSECFLRLSLDYLGFTYPGLEPAVAATRAVQEWMKVAASPSGTTLSKVFGAAAEIATAAERSPDVSELAAQVKRLAEAMQSLAVELSAVRKLASQ